ncbi:MAG: hypothetical protein LLG04_12375 [Parachlamydia sp.]|nr:hypothetical protein [Parachlamydia sp.]
MGIDPQATTKEPKELISLRAHAQEQDARIAEQNRKIQQLEQEIKRLHVSTYEPTISNENLRERIRAKIPRNISYEIRVSTISNHQFLHKKCSARKIELIRKEWGLVNIPFWRSFEAFFLTAITADSIYRHEVNGGELAKGLLESAKFTEGDKQGFARQISAAYWQGIKIEIIIPFDFSESGEMNIECESNLLKYSINSSRWIRSLFTNN